MHESLTETVFRGKKSQIALCGEDSHEQGLVLRGNPAGLGLTICGTPTCTPADLPFWKGDTVSGFHPGSRGQSRCQHHGDLHSAHINGTTGGGGDPVQQGNNVTLDLTCSSWASVSSFTK